MFVLCTLRKCSNDLFRCEEDYALIYISMVVDQ